MAKQKNFNIMMIGVFSFIIITIHNSSQYGASLSWMLPACFLIVIGFVLSKRKKKQSTPVALFLFWFTIFVSTLFSNVVPLERDVFTFAFFLVIYYMVSITDFNEDEIEVIINAYILSALVCCFFIIKNWIAGDYYIEWTLRSSYRFMGEYKDPNYVTAYITPASLFLFFKSVFSQKRVIKLMSLFCLLFSFVAILCTGSRSPVLALGAAIIFYYLFDTSITFNKKILIFTIGFVFLYWVYDIYTQIMPEQVFERLENSSNDSRLKLWKGAIKAFTDSPLIGSGLGSSEAYSIRIVGNYSHNIYIDSLAACGIVGNIFLVYLIIKNCFKTTHFNRKFQLAVGMSFMIPLFFINGLKTATFITPLIMLTILSQYCRKGENRFINLFQ